MGKSVGLRDVLTPVGDPTPDAIFSFFAGFPSWQSWQLAELENS